jgi:hypothetical protein
MRVIDYHLYGDFIYLFDQFIPHEMALTVIALACDPQRLRFIKDTP